MYLTTTISVALVLFLVGLEGVAMLSSHQLVRDLKENITLSVLLTNKLDSTQIHTIGDRLQTQPYCHCLQFISKQEALEDHIASLGEDPEKFLGFNPLSDSYELSLNEHYAVQDSIDLIVEQLEAWPQVERVHHPDQLVSVLNLQLGRFNLVLVLIAVLLLLISAVLIINTIRLHVYSKRFMIRTMRLVGATAWVIRAPFVRRNLIMGLEASALTIIGLVAVVNGAHIRLGIWAFTLNWQNILILLALVIGVAELLTLVASLIATGMYIRMQTDKLYEI